MRFSPTPLKGVWIIEPRILRDARGHFLEVYNQRVFRENGVPDVFVQDNRSRSMQGAWRGLHYQLPPHSQGKLVFVTEGSVFDVAVDIRKGSPSFGQWFGYTLSAENKHALYMPPGFAHGFCVLSETAEVSYKCTALYTADADRTIRWDDPAIGIRLPLAPNPSLVSEKDRNAPFLKDAEIPPLF